MQQWGYCISGGTNAATIKSVLGFDAWYGTNTTARTLAVQPNNTTWEKVIFSDRSQGTPLQISGEAKKVASLRWPSSNKAAFAVIGTNDSVYYRSTTNGVSWTGWTSLGGIARDITAVVWPNGQADIFVVGSDNCTVYQNHSTNGQSWGGWVWWGACGDQIAVAVMPDGTAWAMLRVPTAGNIVAMRYFNGTSWAGSWTALPGTQLAVNDIDLLAYLPPVCCAKTNLWAIGSDNCSLYYRNWSGTSWTDWALGASCFKQVSSFPTSNGGAYMLLIGRDNNYLYTNHFTGQVWEGIVQQGTNTWIAAAGIDEFSVAGN